MKRKYVVSLAASAELLGKIVVEAESSEEAVRIASDPDADVDWIIETIDDVDAGVVSVKEK